MRYNSILPYLSFFNYHFFGSHKLRSSPSELSCQPFFILGSGRNGSTLLSMILNGHSKIFVPGEQFALHYATMRFQLYNFLIWRDIVKIVIGEFADSKNNQEWNTNFNELYSFLYNLPKKERNFQRIIDSIIKEVAQQNGENFCIWGDKSPSTIWFLKYIYRVYPQSKYIFLIRDGRDVVNSYREGGLEFFNEMADVKVAACNWKDSVQKWKWLKKRINPNQLLEIHYEDLVIEPEHQIRKILSFLDLTYEEEILDFRNVVKKRSVLKIPFHQGLAKPIYTDSIGRWEKGMSNHQISKILPIIKKELIEFGYL